MGNFCNSPGAVGGDDITKGIVIRPFNYAEQNGYLKIFIGQFEKKRAWKGA
jgi:hypothetical protein